jgi:hypothetical protein
VLHETTVLRPASPVVGLARSGVKAILIPPDTLSAGIDLA